MHDRESMSHSQIDDLWDSNGRRDKSTRVGRVGRPLSARKDRRIAARFSFFILIVGFIVT